MQFLVVHLLLMKTFAFFLMALLGKLFPSELRGINELQHTTKYHSTSVKHKQFTCDMFTVFVAMITYRFTFLCSRGQGVGGIKYYRCSCVRLYKFSSAKTRQPLIGMICNLVCSFRMMCCIVCVTFIDTARPLPVYWVLQCPKLVTVRGSIETAAIFNTKPKLNIINAYMY